MSRVEIVVHCVAADNVRQFLPQSHKLMSPHLLDQLPIGTVDASDSVKRTRKCLAAAGILGYADGKSTNQHRSG